MSESSTNNGDNSHVKRHIVFVMGQLRGKLMGSLALAERLSEAGYTISYCSLRDWRSEVEAHGYDYFEIQALYQESAIVWQGANLRARLFDGMKHLFTIRQRRDEAVLWDNVHHYLGTLRDLEPDLLIIDNELHAHVIGAISLELPMMLLNRMMTLQKHQNVPPLHRLVTPKVGWRGSALGIEWEWTRHRLIKLRRFWTRRLRKINADKTSVLRHFADELGLSLNKIAHHYQWMMPFSFCDLPVLNLSALEFDFPHQPHPNYHYAGALITQNRQTPDYADDDKDALEAVLMKRESGAIETLIYCAVGSYHTGDDTDFWDEIIKLTNARPNWQFVFGLGGRFDLAKLGDLPVNVLALNWIPQLDVLAVADCAIIHSGINTIIECIHFQVPMLVYPFSSIDQYGNAARIEYHQLGLVGDRQTLTAEQMLKHLEILLHDETIRNQLETMHAHFMKYEEEQRASKIIDDMIAKS